MFAVFLALSERKFHREHCTRRQHHRKKKKQANKKHKGEPTLSERKFHRERKNQTSKQKTQGEPTISKRIPTWSRFVFRSSVLFSAFFWSCKSTQQSTDKHPFTKELCVCVCLCMWKFPDLSSCVRACFKTRVPIVEAPMLRKHITKSQSRVLSVEFSFRKRQEKSEHKSERYPLRVTGCYVGRARRTYNQPTSITVINA